jgi:hypothetical protein
MTTIEKIIGILLLTVVVATGCKPDDSDDSIPFVPFPDIYVNLTLPENFQLQTSGGYKIINEGGVKGIILYNSSGNFYAFERNCSYHPNDACSTVGIDVTGLRMTDSCCGSFFDFEGQPVGGPAWRPLRRYVTIFQASEVVITDDIVE